MPPPKFTQQIEDSIGVPGLSKKLTDAPLSEVNSVLLRSFKERADVTDPVQVFKEYSAKPEFFKPGQLDQREQHKYKTCFFGVLPEDVPCLDLSPVVPFGANSTVTNLSQDVMCTTIRGSEVQGDPTTGLAIEASERRRLRLLNKDTVNDEIRLATSQRILRMQRYDKTKGYMQHYNLFGLCSAGRDKPGLLFSEHAIVDHVSTWLDLVSKLQESELGDFSDIEVKISDMKMIEKLVQNLSLSRDTINKNSQNENWDFFKEFGIDLPSEVQSISDIPTGKLQELGVVDALKNLAFFEGTIFALLRQKYPNIKFTMELNRRTGLGYYDNLCFNLFAKNRDGHNILLSAGGAVGWTAKFLNNQKEKTFASGFGSEFIQKLFKK